MGFGPVLHPETKVAGKGSPSSLPRAEAQRVQGKVLALLQASYVQLVPSFLNYQMAISLPMPSIGLR